MKRDYDKIGTVSGRLSVMAVLTLLVAIQAGCNLTSAQRVAEPPVARYHGPKIGIAVGSFENQTGVEREEYTSETTIRNGTAADEPARTVGIREPFGYGMRSQLITALTQTGVLAVSLDEDMVQYRIQGAITEYEPSQASISGGYGGDDGRQDPSGHTVSPGSNLLQVLTEKAATAFIKQDHVAMNVHLIDLDTNLVVASSAFEASPKDLGAALSLLPGGDLIDLGGQVKTPMQKAVRACLVQAAAWASDQLKVQQVASR